MAKKQEMDNLTRNAIKAQQAGMSYGKYMALQYENGREMRKAAEPDEPEDTERDGRSRRTPAEPKTCVWCGKVFTPYYNHPHIKYCGADCRRLGENYRRVERRRNAERIFGETGEAE